MLELPASPVIIIVSVIAIVAVLLYLREYFLRKKLKSSEKILEQTQQKAYDLLNQAIKKAQAILSMAELEGIKLVASSKLASGKLDRQYQQKLEQSIQSSQVSLTQEIGQAQQDVQLAQQEFIKFLSGLKSQGEKNQADVLTLAQARVSQLFEALETKLSDFLITTEQKTTSSIELELKAARQLIDTYKSEQLKLIDENVIAMMEQTLSIVLAKKLSLKDQLDLVYEALEKAKVEKFIV